MNTAEGADMIQLELAMTYTLDVTGPLVSSDAAPETPGVKFWQMTHATLVGPNIRATTPLPGIDWFTPLGEGYGRPHVRLPFQTDDGAVILLEYGGVVHATEAFTRAVEQDTSTEFAEQYMRMALSFETTSPRYAWLTQSLFIARGRLLAAKRIEYEIYRVL